MLVWTTHVFKGTTEEKLVWWEKFHIIYSTVPFILKDTHKDFGRFPENIQLFKIFEIQAALTKYTHAFPHIFISFISMENNFW